MHFFPFHKTPHDRPEQLTTDSPHTDAEGRSTAGSDVAAHTALKQKRNYGLAQKREQPCAQKNRVAGIAFCRDAEQTNRSPCEKNTGTHLKCFYILTK